MSWQSGWSVHTVGKLGEYSDPRDTALGVTLQV